MKLFAIGDTHLSLGVSKPMDIFRGWENYSQLIEENWRRLVSDEDAVVIPGDLSWGLDLEQAGPDLHFLDSLPGQKYIFKGNHDLWWPTNKKLNAFFETEGITTITPLLHTAVKIGERVICGTRGWFLEDANYDEKVYKREVLRLEMALNDAVKLGGADICFLHYPPLSHSYICAEMLGLLERYGVRECYYGHIHGPSIQGAFIGERNGIRYKLVSADALGFVPERIF